MSIFKNKNCWVGRTTSQKTCDEQEIISAQEFHPNHLMRNESGGLRAVRFLPTARGVLARCISWTCDCNGCQRLAPLQGGGFSICITAEFIGCSVVLISPPTHFLL